MHGGRAADRLGPHARRNGLRVLSPEWGWRVFKAAEEVGLPFGIHPCFEPLWAAPGRYEGMTGMKHSFFLNVTAPDAVLAVDAALTNDTRAHVAEVRNADQE